MDYFQARAYLDQVSVSGSILGLDSIRNLMAELGNPQDSLKIVHLAGTNGKGSILSYTVSVLKEAGYKVGSYSSPSVLGYLERFQINAEWMKEEELAPYVEDVKKAAESMQEKGLACPTVFEMETAIAFLYFYKNKCDYIVLETGMGGELDSTNVIKDPLVCAFASISLDHLGVLGNNLEEIAATKSGIIKEGATIVTGWQRPEAERILEMAAKNKGCEILKVAKESISRKVDQFQQIFDYKNHKDLVINLLGNHQIENATTAVEIIEALKNKGALISEESLKEGLKNTRWPGRFELIMTDEKRRFVVDGAHNEDAAKRLAEGLTQYFPDVKFEAVMGVFKDKDYGTIVDILSPYLKKVYTIDLPNKARTLKKEALAEVLRARGVEAKAARNLEDAISKTQGATLITGSLSYLGEALKIIKK